jgi:hypothetical protein
MAEIINPIISELMTHIIKSDTSIAVAASVSNNPVKILANIINPPLSYKKF